MELEEQLTDFAGRIQSGCGSYVSYDEVQQWPKGRLEELLDMGVLIATTPAKEINCTECSGMDCPPIEPSIETFPGASEPEGAYLCKKEGGGGLIRIPLERMRRWEIVVERLIELRYLKNTDTTEPNEKWKTVGETAKELIIHAGTVGRWVEAGKLTDNGKTGPERRISWSSILIVKDQKERKQYEGDVDDLRRDAANIPKEH